MFNSNTHKVVVDPNNFALAAATILASPNRGKFIEINGIRYSTPPNQEKYTIYTYTGLITRIAEVENKNSDLFAITYIGEKEKGQIFVHKDQVADILKKINE